MFSRFRHVFGIIFFLLVASCSGGGCSSGCGGCGGMTPLPGGFPKDKAIENAASVRVSRPGLTFLEQNLPAVAAKVANAPGGKMSFEIPTISLNQPKVFSINLGITSVDFDLVGSVCPGGPNKTTTPPRCVAEVNIGASTFQLDSVTPNALTVRATIPIQLDDTPINVDINPGPALTLHVGYGSNGTCTGPSQALASVQPKALPVTITIPLVEETTAPRTGYTKIDVDNAVVNLNAIQSGDVRICADCGPLSFEVLGFEVNLCNTVLNLGFIKDLFVNQLKGGLDSQVKGLLRDQLCTAPNPALNPPCPSGSSPDAGNKRCVFDSDKNKCVSILLGTDSHVDLGGALKSISPGTSGGIDFALAAGGAMKPAPGAAANPQGRTPNGVTLGMVGGVIPQPASKCVPRAELQVPAGIPLPDELAPTTPDATTAPHVGIALAGRFLDYSFGSVYNSGLLCLGVSSEQIDMLRAGLLSLLVPSLKNLTFEQGDAAAAIATRPQAPPTVKIGGGTNLASDPLLSVKLPKFAIDFYIWHLDRFIRALTFQADLTIPVNLQTSKDGILPALGDIKVENGQVLNADMLMEEPGLVAGAISGLLGGLGKQLVGGGLSPIDLSGALSSAGLNLEVGEIKKLTKGADDFVGIFASLSKAAGTATVEADTTATLVSKTVHKDHMQLGTIDRAFRPELVVDVASSIDDGTRRIEYSWWIDGGTRSEWSTAKRVVVNDDQLLLQGRHVLKVASRIAGEHTTEDVTPAEIPFTIDAVAPFVNVEKDGTTAVIKAWDLVSAQEALVGRYRLDEGELSPWMPVKDMARVDVSGARVLDAEVKDEEGNVQSIKQELIRGKVDSSIGGGGSDCGCSTPGKRDTGGFAAVVVGLAALGLVTLRRRLGSARAGALALGTIGAVAATSQGCACGSEADLTGTSCGPTCDQECKPGLPLGRPGAYTSVAKAKDNTIWVAGYNDALLQDGDNLLWGDLVVGKYDIGKQRVDWKTVDGMPARAEGCADRAKDSWRNGEEDSGDNVGLWTSIQVSAAGNPMVSYYDSTKKRLKYAVLLDDQWKVITLAEGSGGADIGRYSKMVLVDGKPVIVFLVIEDGPGGKTRSKISVARANVEVPAEPSDFRFEDAAIADDNPCRVANCGPGKACTKDVGTCEPTVGGCTPADCGDGKACVTREGKATCVSTKGAIETVPEVFGTYISVAVAGNKLGIASYDRAHGNLIALTEGNGRWERFIVDGETGNRADKTAIDTGDVGLSASLQIDNAGTWHMTYVSGLDETLRYITFAGGKPGKAEIIDDGSAVDGRTFTDGKHIVGDDSALRVDGDTVVVYYQDATAWTLRRAVGTKQGAARKWDLRTIQQPNRIAGFHPAIVPGEDRVANFWRETLDRSNQTVVGDVSILSP